MSSLGIKGCPTVRSILCRYEVAFTVLRTLLYVGTEYVHAVLRPTPPPTRTYYSPYLLISRWVISKVQVNSLHCRSIIHSITIQYFHLGLWLRRHYLFTFSSPQHGQCPRPNDLLLLYIVDHPGYSVPQPTWTSHKIVSTEPIGIPVVHDHL